VHIIVCGKNGLSQNFLTALGWFPINDALGKAVYAASILPLIRVLSNEFFHEYDTGIKGGLNLG
jgi:hypothetical protein